MSLFQLRCRLYGFSLLIFLVSPLLSQTGVERLVKQPALKHASAGVSVVDLESGETVVDWDADKSLTPASVLKLVTTATALERMGENYHYKTDVALDADDPSRILVMGSGDPTLGSAAFNDDSHSFFIHCAAALRKALPSDRDYSIYVVDHLFGYDGVSPEWTWVDMGNYYAAGAYGISVFDNSYRLVFTTADLNRCPVILRTEPEIKGLTFHNALSLNSSGRDNGYIYGAPFSYDRSVRGNIPGGRKEFSIKGDVPDPGRLLGETLADYLSKAGLKVKKVQTARNDYLASVCGKEKYVQPKPGKVIFTLVSPSMKEIVREVNVTSNNHYAEHLIRLIGRTVSPDIYSDPLSAGIEEVVRYWREKGLDVSSLLMFDGCGLAPQDAVSPRFLTDLLRHMYNESAGASAFYQSLPKAGAEGTLSYFLKNSRLAGKVVAKSGSIGGVQCFAGYLTEGGKKYAFAIMVNKFAGNDRSKVRMAIEQFLLAVDDSL